MPPTTPYLTSQYLPPNKKLYLHMASLSPQLGLRSLVTDQADLSYGKRIPVKAFKTAESSSIL